MSGVAAGSRCAVAAAAGRSTARVAGQDRGGGQVPVPVATAHARVRDAVSVRDAATGLRVPAGAGRELPGAGWPAGREFLRVGLRTKIGSLCLAVCSTASSWRGDGLSPPSSVLRLWRRQALLACRRPQPRPRPRPRRR